MALLTADIRKIIENKGNISFGSTVTAGTTAIITNTGDAVVENNYIKMGLTANLATNTITMTRVANDSTTNNGVNIRTIDAVSAIGAVNMPGYVYTGDFSGCVFYLYKTGPGEVTGIHAYSGSQAVTTKGWLGRKTINQVVREFGPTDYYSRNPGQMICRYPTRGEMDVTKDGEKSLSFLSCVERNTASTFLFGVSGNGLGVLNVTRLIRAYHVKF